VTEPEPAPEPITVAAFDFDGTLTEGGSVFPFLVSLRGRARVLLTTARQAPELVHAALAGGTTADTAKERLFTRLLGGLAVTDVDQTAATFAEDHLERHLRPLAAERLAWHQAQGHHVVIISASPECYVKAAGKRLGVDGTVATRLAVGEDGRLTGRYDGKNCRGTEKLNRLTEHLEGLGFDGPGDGRVAVWAYGNSRGDLRLLQAADHGVDAGKLGRWGRLRRFPRLADVSRAAARPTS
jgi:phosphatidylglycerophosphatase C